MPCRGAHKIIGRAAFDQISISWAINLSGYPFFLIFLSGRSQNYQRATSPAYFYHMEHKFIRIAAYSNFFIKE
jgi:hypothetical protein